MGIIKEQFTLSMLLFHLFMCNPIYEHFWRSQTDSVVSSGWCLAGGGDDGWLSGATGRAGMVRAFGV